jgi:hypothetical protein
MGKGVVSAKQSIKGPEGPTRTGKAPMQQLQHIICNEEPCEVRSGSLKVELQSSRCCPGQASLEDDACPLPYTFGMRRGMQAGGEVLNPGEQREECQGEGGMKC